METRNNFLVISTSADAAPEDVAAGVEIYLLPHPKKNAPDTGDGHG